MVIGLQNVGRRYESPFVTDGGYPFMAAIMPLMERSVASYDFSEPRQLLRVSHDCPIASRMEVIDIADRRFLLADNDDAYVGETRLYRSHRIFPMNRQVSWKREASVLDPLTKLVKSTGVTDLGMIWILKEQSGRERADNVIKVAEETHRIITGAEIRLNDLIDGVRVKRLDIALGVSLGEIQ